MIKSKVYFFVALLLPIIVFSLLISTKNEIIGWMVFFVTGILAIWAFISLFYCYSKNITQIKSYFVKSPLFLPLPYLFIQITGFMSSINSPYLDVSFLKVASGFLLQFFALSAIQILTAYIFIGIVFIGYNVFKKSGLIYE